MNSPIDPIPAAPATPRSRVEPRNVEQYVRFQRFFIKPMLDEIPDTDNASQLAIINHWQVPDLGRQVTTGALMSFST